MRKRKQICNRIMAIIMVLLMVFSVVPENVYAAASISTDEIDTPVEATEHAEVYFLNQATGKLITLDGKTNNPIDCNQEPKIGDIQKNGLFTVYYGIGKGSPAAFKGKNVVNFTCAGTNTSWKSDGSKVFQMNKETNPGGWESVYMEPQGDGTVAFRNNNNGNYFTVKDGKLEIVELKAGEKTSSNEKFIMYTETKPKTAKKVTLSDFTGSTMNVSWQGVDECLYSGYQVLYSKTEDGEYTVAGNTIDTSFEITGLDVRTKYFVKIRTVTNNEGGAYADSQVAYAETTADIRPTVPTNLTVTEVNGKPSLSWDKASNAASYKIYRAVSRYADYQEIQSGVIDTTFTDENANPSKYSNYYKVVACNGSVESAMSEPNSIEMTMFGPNAYIFTEADNQAEIDNLEAEIFDKQHYNQFGKERYALMYKPGNYTSTKVPIQTGYYTQILGLGKVPTDVSLPNVKTPAALSGNNVTCNFWQAIENITIKDLDNNGDDYFSFQWAVSQAAPARRLNVERKAVFDWWNGWASGGYFADTYFQKPSGSYSQQQYYYRNCKMDAGTYGINWNQLLQGCDGITADNKDNGAGMENAIELLGGNGKTNWSQGGCTTVVDTTPVIREKPFLYFDTEADKYKVFIPALRKDSKGISWSEDNMGEGTSISVDKYFYIANPERDSAATINQQLKAGKNILFQPGIYHVTEPIKVTKANTVLLGIGMATIIPDNEESAIITDDVGGVSIAGLILDAGNYSKTLLKVGKDGSNKNHADNPTALHDIIYRVGGTGELGRSDSCQVINSNDVIIDQTWIWRADHGNQVAWDKNTSKNGLVVNGDNVTVYGLFCEHFQEYDIIWRGENGRTYFLQNEKCYDPQKQSEWMSHDGTVEGYAAYKVANNVTKHYAVGLGVYDVFINTNGASIHCENAVEVPDKPDVLIENACIVEIAAASGPQVGINNIVNNSGPGIRTGDGASGGYAVQRLLSYQNGASISMGDYYAGENKVVQPEEQGVEPTNDALADVELVKDPATKDDEKPLWQMTESDFDQKIENSDVPLDNPTNPGNQKPGQNQNQNQTSQESDADYVYRVYGVKVGGVYTIDKYIYKVTSVTRASGKATVIGVAPKYKAGLKTAAIPASATYKGYTLNATAVGAKAFTKLKKLTKVTFGKNIKKIGTSAFAGCPKLKTIKFKNVTNIGKKAFYNCKALKKVTIGNKVTTVGKSAFAKCKKITRVTFGKKVKTVKAKAFANSKKLKKVIFKGKKLKKIAKNVFAKKVRKKVKITAKNKKVKKIVLKSLK